ncbi:o-succinylbenzoate synthase [bacterium 336/3]|nr:o-succinylbenzoate synthase [bacterium 336/3]
MQITYTPYTFDFKFEAGTSRGVLTQKKNYFIKIVDKQGNTGIGEVNVLKGLSIDDREDFKEKLEIILKQYQENEIDEHLLNKFPSVRFALETAQKDLENGGNKIIYPTKFTEGTHFIPINGLIWMGNKEHMLSQIAEKVKSGFNCLKMKIGAINFEEELEILRFIRKEFSEKDMILRVDANGAFSPETALEKLKKLSDFQLHSIEQPIQPTQYEQMAYLCEHSPVPIALDEELIGIQDYNEKKKLLETLKPPYIILKPALLGGFQKSEEWIELAEKQQINWWVTSALEGNIGLNAIAQWTSHLAYKGHQGLGTGQLYTNNIPSPLVVDKGLLKYDKTFGWGKV